ncbi:hypothetical protein [Bradyrhizobium yuanmingense]|uniref:hypothetical protein n=1 Tax=Bradyrhizobium yuanmingense TaxID=108015 RepID=UPI0023B92F5F|nr:hypothetical protein [Bradyrhizobium yuanmingense]MDF0498167.1 hypothetical protein [Bradyrhizobium yuanmingense]
MLVAAEAFASDRSVYTPANGSSCVDASRENFGSWTCPGPGGYRIDFSDEGNIAGVAIRPSRAARREGYAFRGAGTVFGDRVEWILTNGVPEAAILRIWRAEGDDGIVQELIVLKVTPAGSCRIASVSTKRPDANDLAREEASHASQRSCDK